MDAVDGSAEAGGAHVVQQHRRLVVGHLIDQPVAPASILADDAQLVRLALPRAPPQLAVLAGLVMAVVVDIERRGVS